MKTNGDEKETHLAETTATYALGVFCQLVNPYISGVDHHKKGFMKDFFDAVLEDDGLRNPLPQHHRNRKPGKTTITTGVWSGINDTDLTRFYRPFAVWCGWVCQVVTVLRSSLPQVR